MSYTNHVGDLTVHVICQSDPQGTYDEYYDDLARCIKESGYTPQTSMDNLIKNVVLMFDCDDNYGEYDEDTGCGGYGDGFTLEECLRYVEESGGWKEFDYEV